jgi:dienelactone hydrolase
MGSELLRLGVEYKFHAYDGDGHVFMDPSNVHGFNQEIVNDAWLKVISLKNEITFSVKG